MTFSSVYQMFDPLTTVRKQHFWTWFSGSALDSIWSVYELATPITGMSDTVNGGYEVTGNSASDQSRIHFNDKRQYAHDGSVFIAVVQNNGMGTSGGSNYGFNGNKDQPSPSASDGATWQQTGGNTTWLTTGNGTSRTLNNVTRTPDDIEHVWSIVCGASTVIGSIDGVSTGTNTTNLPTAKMQPLLHHQYESSTSSSFFRYLECYNT